MKNQNPIRFKMDYGTEEDEVKKKSGRNMYDATILPSDVLVDVYQELSNKDILSDEENNEMDIMETEIKKRGIPVPGMVPEVVPSPAGNVTVNIQNLTINKNAGQIKDLLTKVQEWIDDGLSVTVEDISGRAQEEAMRGNLTQEELKYIQEDAPKFVSMLRKMSKRITKKVSVTNKEAVREVVNKFDLDILEDSVEKLSDVVLEQSDPEPFFYLKFILDWISATRKKLLNAKEALPEQADYEHQDLEYVTQKKGHADTFVPTVAIDFDGVLAGLATFPDIGEPLAGGKEALMALKDKGWKVVIYTCRIREDQPGEHAKVDAWLKRHEIPFDEITGQKPVAEYYVDDRAIPFKGSWMEILPQILNPKVANDPIKEVADIDGVKVDIEWPKGSTRHYKNDPRQTFMKADYGYVRKTDTPDGEELDIYLGPDRTSREVWRLKQLNEDGSYDEDKFMLGYHSEKEARESYLEHIPDDNRIGEMIKFSWDEFKKLVSDLQK